jgi:two-component system cell cycle response regulator
MVSEQVPSPDPQALLEEMKREIERLREEIARSREDLEMAEAAPSGNAAQFPEKERLEILMQIAGATAHELSQPLTALLGYTQILQESPDCPPSLQSLAEKIYRGAERIAATVDRIQKVHRYETIPYLENRRIVRFDLTYRVLVFEGEDDDLVSSLLRPFQDHFEVSRVSSIIAGLKALKENSYDIALVSQTGQVEFPLENFHVRPDLPGFPPLVLVTSSSEEVLDPSLLPDSFLDVVSRHRLDEESLIRTLRSTLERARLEWEVRKAQERLYRIETQDELTGIMGQQHILQTFVEHMTVALVDHHALSVAILDLDRLDEVNAKFGHQAGNNVLKTVANLLAKELRQSDLCGRYGGDEFLILIKGLQAYSAAKVVSRIQKQIRNLTFEDDKGHPYSVSACVGLADVIGTGENPEKILSRAEQALRLAKNQKPGSLKIG